MLEVIKVRMFSSEMKGIIESSSIQSIKGVELLLTSYMHFAIRFVL